MTIAKIIHGCLLLALLWGAAVEVALAEGQGPLPAAGEQTVIPVSGGRQTAQPVAAPSQGQGAAPPPAAGEQTVIPVPGGRQTAQPAALPPGSASNIEQPAPLNVTGIPADTGRDPFVAPPRKIFTPDYGKGMDACLLRGICMVGRKQIGIFSTAGKGGSSASSGAGERFQRVGVGEQIKFFSENVEYILTVRELGARSAVLVGENKQVYKVYL